MWRPDYRQENQGIVLQLSGGQQVSLFSTASRLAVQAIDPSTQCTPRALSPVVQWLAYTVLKLRMSGKILPLPCAFMLCTGTTLISKKYGLYM